jgi:hypothetical protein
MIIIYKIPLLIYSVRFIDHCLYSSEKRKTKTSVSNLSAIMFMIVLFKDSIENHIRKIKLVTEFT